MRNHSFMDFILDQLSNLRGMTSRAMFGGYGLYRDGIFFGIIHNGRLYFKTTAETVASYRAHGMNVFRPNAKQTLKTYYEVPVDVIEDAEQLTTWAEQACSTHHPPSAPRRHVTRRVSQKKKSRPTASH